MRNTTHKQQEIENQKAKIRLEQEKLRANKKKTATIKEPAAHSKRNRIRSIDVNLVTNKLL
jgi:hypothetical protein